MIQQPEGKLTAGDKKFSRLLNGLAWLLPPLLAFPVPLVFFALFLASVTTESAAVYLFLAGITLGLGFFAGLAVLVFLLIYRNRWRRRLRDRLAADGITAAELPWFTKELSSAERKALRETNEQNPLLADAYRETLASRLTASRIIARTDREMVKVRSRIRRARSLVGADTAELLRDLESDQQQLETLKNEASSRLLEARARLQTIEAAASRSLNQRETVSMLRRLSATQEHLPLVIEMERLERETLQEAELQLRERESSLLGSTQDSGKSRQR